MENKTYYAFLSYSHSDKKWAKWLHHSLETYRVPPHLVGKEMATGAVPARLTPIFRDREELASSPDLSRHIKDALGKSENLIVICSPRSARSRWVDKEIETFKRLGRSNRIFSIIVDGEPNSNEAGINCFPSTLCASYDSDGKPLASEIEPVAADARKQGDGRSLARLKIISGLLGVGLDELRQRELQRRNRRMLTITIASLVALVITAMLAFSASVARDEANQRRQQAEGLLSFMVGDLRDSLEPIGRLDLLEQVGEKAMAYFATINAGDLTNEELLRHAQVLTQLGEIRMSQRLYDNALTSFMEAYKRSAELSDNSPDNGEHLFGRGQAEFWVGYVHWRRGDFPAARDWLTRYRDSSQLLSNLDSQRDDWTREVAYGDHNLAVLAWESGDLEAAETGFKRELKTLLELQNRDTGPDLQRDIADTVSWLGTVVLGTGDLETARDYFKRSSEMLRSLLLAEPDDAARKYAWAYSIQRLLEVAAITGDTRHAETLADQALSVFEKLVAQDQANKDWVRSYTRTLISKGNLLTARGDFDNARSYATRSVGLIETLIAEEASDLTSREQLADAYSLGAWIDYSQGNPGEALDSSYESLKNIQLLQRADHLNDDRLGKLTSTLVFLGQLEVSLEQPENARQLWQQARALLKDTANTTQTPVLLDPWARVLILTGQVDEATKIISKLETGHYRPLRPWPETAN